MTPELAALLAWVSIYSWLAIAVAFFCVSVVVHFLTRGLLKSALRLGNGKIKVARRRLRVSRWYLLGSGLALCLGLLSAYSAFYLPHPPPDTRAVGAVVRFGIVTMLFAFLMTKIENLRTFGDFGGGGTQTDRIEATSRDTNSRVKEMQERGQSDQPEEQTDRIEGHKHRAGIDEALRADTERRATEREDDRQERKEERKQDREEREQERQDS